MEFDDLRAYLEVAHRGSFFAAAEALRTSRTTLRRQVDALEARAGVPLLVRTRNGVVPTEAGQRLLESGKRLSEEFAATLASVREAGRVPAGELRIALPVGLPPQALVLLTSLMAERWPQLRFHPRFYDSIEEAERMGVEVVVTMGGRGPESGWVCRVAATVPRRLLASQEYLADRGVPAKLEDLARHDLFSWLAPGETGTEWATSSGPYSVVPHMVTTDAHLLHLMAQESRGLVYVPDGGFDPAFGLVHVLPGLVGDNIQVRVCSPLASAELPRVRAVMEIAGQVAGLFGLGNEGT